MHRFPVIVLVCALACLGRAETVVVTVLATTDLHGSVMPYDYYSARPVPHGLAKLATLIYAARAVNPNVVLVDVGDTIQGSPIETLYQQYVNTGRLPLNLSFSGEPPRVDPMMLVMNRIGYDAMVLGNHEFNFGLKNLQKARSDASFPWISANTKAAGGAKPFLPYIVRNVRGVKVAVIGITTPAIPQWEKPENYQGYSFEPGEKAMAATISALRAKEKPDLIIGAVHAGLERDLKTGQTRSGETEGENMVYRIATTSPGLDAIVFGHSHRELDGYLAGNVLLVQPKNSGGSLARIDFTLEGEPGRWKVVSKKSRLEPATDLTPANAEIVRMIRPYHEVTERYLNTRVTESPVEMRAALARVEDTPILDAVQAVQLHYSKADVSLTALFNGGAVIPKGPVTVRQVAALYIYENELYAIEGTGKMLREALENSARYFLTCPDATCSEGPRFNREVAAFNYDIAQGVDYDIDVMKPEGRRITRLTWKGQPLKDDQKLRIAVNNYRAGGSGGYAMFRGAKIVWRSSQEIRDLIIDYYSGPGRLPAQADNNWRIVPESALPAMERAALAVTRSQ